MNNPQRLAWEDDVYTGIEQRLEVCRSDAQAIVEAKESLLEQAWSDGVAASEAIDRIIAT